MTGDNEVHNLEELYTAYASSVFSYLLHLSGDGPLAEDLTSDTFYQAMLNLDGFEGRSSVKTWLLRIARNLYLRRSARERRHVSMEALQAQGVLFRAADEEPEMAAARHEQYALIRQALQALSESDRSILALSLQETLSMQDIAGVLDLSLAAAKVRLFRARQRLAAEVDRLQSFQPA